MFELIRAMSRATDVVDINIAAGIARPKLKRYALLGGVIIIEALVVATLALWVSYYALNKHLTQQDQVVQNTAQRSESQRHLIIRLERQNESLLDQIKSKN